jgi:hypothetical protein
MSCLPTSNVSLNPANLICLLLTISVALTLLPSNSAYTEASVASTHENPITISWKSSDPFLTVVENLTSSAFDPAFSTVLEAAELATVIEADSVISRATAETGVALASLP